MNSDTLKKLLPYLQEKTYYVVGGLVIRYYLQQNSIESPFEKENDIDVCIDSVIDLSSDIQKDFLIYHYHPQEGFLALVDADAKVKIDCFPYRPESESKTVEIDSFSFPIATIEDQLTHEVLDIQKVDGIFPVDPKQFGSAEKLMKIADVHHANEIWNRIRNSKYSPSLEESYQHARKIADEHPDMLKKDPFKKDKPYHCEQCDYSGKFKITPMEEIYRILGYAE